MIMPSLQQFSRFRWYVILGGILFFCILAVFIVFIMKNIGQTEPATEPSAPVTPGASQQQQAFRVISTIPPNNASGIYAGEQVVTVVTDVPITAVNNATVVFNPRLDYQPVIANTYPTRVLSLKILGGFHINTRYTAQVRDAMGAVIYTWNFTTSDQVGQGDSGLQAELDKQINEDFYPLIQFLPYKTQNYLLGYANHKELRITLRKSGLDRNAILTEVRAWVQSKGVDPNSHTYVFAGEN